MVVAAIPDIDGWAEVDDPMRFDDDAPSEPIPSGPVAPVVTWGFRQRRAQPAEPAPAVAAVARPPGLLPPAVLPVLMVVVATAILAVAVAVFGSDRVGEAPIVRTVDPTTATTFATDEPRTTTNGDVASVQEELQSRDTGVIVIPALD
jgi:hypothetical protein